LWTRFAKTFVGPSSSFFHHQDGIFHRAASAILQWQSGLFSKIEKEN
jgi:hypothetical protein